MSTRTSGEALQAVAVALVFILATDAGVAAITGRPTKNLVRGKPRAGHAIPLLAYELLEATESEHGDGAADFDVALVLAAIGRSATEVHALLGAVERALSVPAFAAAGLDATVMDFDSRLIDPASTELLANPDRVGAEADVVVWVSLASPA